MNPHPHISKASQIISDKLGLCFPEERYRDLDSGLKSAARELGFEDDGNAFMSLLIEKKLSAKQLEILAEQLTIGETYFFREQQTLSAFREMIIPALVKEREHTTRSLRIWSAGCCSGEEPYTLAIILSEIIPDIESWNITILATDINRRFLEKAAKGKYTPWSFRETPPETKRLYFLPHGKEFEITPRIRDMVRFQPLNLVDDPFPSERNNTNSMDVIFCRNVLMYFTPHQAKVVGEKFFRALTDQGWFITSQVELSDELFHLLGKVQYKSAFLYRKTNRPYDLPKKLPDLGSKLRSNPDSPARKHHSLRQQTVRKPDPAVPRSHPNTETADTIATELDLARQYANQGDLTNALRCSEKLIQADKSNPEAYYFQGVILFEQGETEKAEGYLKKALYLDPDHLLAHFQMATLCRKAGKEKQARKHTLNVTELLHQYQDDEIIPGSDGMTAGHLKSMIQPLTKADHDR